MSEQYDSQPSTSRRFWLGAFAFLLLAALLAAAGYGGFLMGQADMAPESLDPLPAVAAATGVPISTAVPVTSTAIVATATQTQIVEKIVPQDLPAAAETPVATVEATADTESALHDGSAADGEALDLALFYEVWGLVGQEFDGQLPEDKDLLYGAIAGALETLDDTYTRFIRPEVAQRLRDDLDGSVSGIGAIVRPGEDGFVEIVRPIDDQPADLAGLLAGDLIFAVDGQPVEGISFDEVLLLVRGPEGTVVTLTVIREGADSHLDFSLERALFEVPIVEFETFEEGGQTIGYLRLSSFTKTAEADLLQAVASLLDEELDGLVFDLRDNGGGFLDQAVAVADVFLPEGIVLYERSATGEVDTVFRSDTGDLLETLPLVVLVNAGSASASEIVAGAVKDTGRGILVGEPTFGKGSVQHVHTLSDGSELRVTIARWYTPDNRSIADEGIEPDIEVPSPRDLGGTEDEQLQRAIDYLVNGP